jgi:formate dehydrogenase major subunit
VWWDAAQGRWTSVGDNPDFPPDRAPDYVPPEEAWGMDSIRGNAPFIVHPDGLGWLFAPSGLVDGPLPTHYEPHESPVKNLLYDRVDANPTRQRLREETNPYNPSAGAPGADVFPYTFTTYRLTEHHTAGGMSRTLPYLSELQPEMFVEVSPDLAAERALVHGDWATIVTARAAIEARVLVTDRMRPVIVDGRPVHQVGLPYHWGRRGIATGDAANDLLSEVLDLNVHISEYKAATCDVRPGRRPRGRALTAMVEDYRRRARVVYESRHDHRGGAGR